MIARICKILLVGILTLLGSTIARGDGISFSLLPSGNISGTAGSTTGWGYTVTDTSSDETLQLLSINAGIFQYGTFDSSLFAFDFLTPGQSDTWIFDPTNFSGLASFTIDPNAPAGTIDAGNFIISYELCGATCADSTLTVPYSITATPEPSTRLLFLCALPLLYGLKRRFQQQTSGS